MARNDNGIIGEIELKFNRDYLKFYIEMIISTKHLRNLLFFLLCVCFFACTNRATFESSQEDLTSQHIMCADSIDSFRVYSNIQHNCFFSCFEEDSMYEVAFRYYEYPEACIDSFVLKRIQVQLDSILYESPHDIDTIPSLSSPIFSLDELDELEEYNGMKQCWLYSYLTTAYNAHGVYSCCNSQGNGGANYVHPIYTSFYHTFDLKTGNEISLDQLLSCSQIVQLSNLVLRYADPGWEEFRNFEEYTFYFDNKGIVLHYNPYVINCWARGERYLRIECDPIKVLNKDSLYIDDILSNMNNLIEFESFTSCRKN